MMNANSRQGYNATTPQPMALAPGSRPPYFSDKKVLITGASSGLGMALAFYYLNNGAQVALVGRDIETLTKIGEQFPS